LANGKNYFGAESGSGVLAVQLEVWGSAVNSLVGIREESHPPEGFH